MYKPGARPDNLVKTQTESDLNTADDAKSEEKDLV